MVSASNASGSTMISIRNSVMISAASQRRPRSHCSMRLYIGQVAKAHDRSRQQGRHERLQYQQAADDQHRDRGELRNLLDSSFHRPVLSIRVSLSV